MIYGRQRLIRQTRGISLVCLFFTFFYSVAENNPFYHSGRDRCQLDITIVIRWLRRLRRAILPLAQSIRIAYGIPSNIRISIHPSVQPEGSLSPVP